MAKSGRPKTNSATVTTDIEVKAPVSVEQVKPETKAEEIKETKAEKSEETKKIDFAEKTYTVENKEKAGKSIYATTGEIITFDENGRAKVGMKDAEHLSHVPGYSVIEK